MLENKIYLYLDDVRTPLDPTWQVVRNYDEFVAHINLHGLDQYECISFDHDLGEEAMKEYYRNVKPNSFINYDNISEKTGMDCARWVVDLALREKRQLPITYVHSANPVGTENIINYINNYYKSQGVSEKCVAVNVEHTFMDVLTKAEIRRRIAIMMGDLN
jgi:hypothetical protein